MAAQKPTRKDLMNKSLSKADQQLADRFAAAKETAVTSPKGLLSKNSSIDKNNEETNSNNKSIISIAVSELNDNPHNARQIYDELTVRERANSIATSGQLEPVKVFKNIEDNKYYLIDGHYRKQACLLINKTELDCIVLEVTSLADVYKYSFILNEQRSPQSALDNALAWDKLLKSNVVKTDDDLSVLTGFSKGHISKTLSILSLSQTCVDLMKEHIDKFPATIAYEIVLFERASQSEDETIDLIKKVIDEDLSRREIQNIKESLINKVGRKVREVSRQHKISIKGKMTGMLKDWDSGRVLLDIKVEDPEKRNEILEFIKQKFEINN